MRQRSMEVTFLSHCTPEEATTRRERIHMNLPIKGHDDSFKWPPWNISMSIKS